MSESHRHRIVDDERSIRALVSEPRQDPLPMDLTERILVRKADWDFYRSRCTHVPAKGPCDPKCGEQSCPWCIVERQGKRINELESQLETLRQSQTNSTEKSKGSE